MSKCPFIWFLVWLEAPGSLFQDRHVVEVGLISPVKDDTASQGLACGPQSLAAPGALSTLLAAFSTSVILHVSVT